MIYVVDTSVFLSDHKALKKLEDKDVVIPLVVISELEAKRSHPELGFAAREVLRTLENLRSTYGVRITDKIPLGRGGSIRVEVNNIENSELPTPFRVDSNDNRILTVASNLKKYTSVTLLTKDLTLRLKASIVGLEAEDFDPEPEQPKPTPIIELNVESEEIDAIYTSKSIKLKEEFPPNTNLILKSPLSSALARFKADRRAYLIQDARVFDVRGRSAEQRFAINLLQDPSVSIVSLAGKAGTGKSLLALAAGFEAVIERNEFKKVIVFRPLYPVGGQDLGFLPGDAEEKMSPWAAAVFDALEAFCGPNVIEEIIERKLLEVLPLTHIRGRTLSNSYVIFDETQNYDEPVILTALSRLGQGSKAVLTYDVAQRDNLRVGRNDGIAKVAAKLAGHALFGHVTLNKSERSEIAELVSTLLD